MIQPAQGQHWDLAPYTRAALYLFATGELATHAGCAEKLRCWHALLTCPGSNSGDACSGATDTQRGTGGTCTAGCCSSGCAPAAISVCRRPSAHHLPHPCLGVLCVNLTIKPPLCSSRVSTNFLPVRLPGLPSQHAPQVVWGLSLLIAAPVLLSARLIPDSHVEALLGAAAVGAVFAELFMIKVQAGPSPWHVHDAWALG